MKYLVFGFI